MFAIIRPTFEQLEAWSAMRFELWPHHTVDELRAEAKGYLSTPDTTPIFLCVNEVNQPIGFLEGSIRPNAEGCRSDKVGYVEGWFVKKELRGTGIGADLMRAFFVWCLDQGIYEVGSDTWLWNEDSIKAHAAMGFTETERLVHFRKNLLQ